MRRLCDCGIRSLEALIALTIFISPSDYDIFPAISLTKSKSHFSKDGPVQAQKVNTCKENICYSCLRDRVNVVFLPARFKD